jgi:hypothetical protein
MMDISITLPVDSKEDAIEMLDNILAQVEKKFRPGWGGQFTMTFECRGKYHTTPLGHQDTPGSQP